MARKVQARTLLENKRRLNLKPGGFGLGAFRRGGVGLQLQTLAAVKVPYAS